MKILLHALSRINATGFVNRGTGHPTGEWLSPLRSKADYFAIVLMKKGELSIIHNGQESRILEHDLFFILPGSRYQFRIPSQDREEENIVIKFRYDRCLPVREGLYSIAEVPHLRTRIEQILTEHRLKNAMYKDKQRAILGDILIDLFRLGKRNIHPAGPLSPTITRAVTRIHGNIGRRLNILSLAAEAGYSLPYFSAKFKRETGFSPKKYLMQFKIRLAKDLLRTTNLNMGQISQRLGFTDVFDFSRYFRKTVGTAPTLFRRSLA